MSLVLITTGTMRSAWNDVTLFNADQVKPTFVKTGFNNVHMGLSVYTGYLAANFIANYTTDNTLVSKLPYQLTGAFLGGVASNFSFCKPFIWTLGLGALGYKFRAPLYNICVWMMTKPKQVQNQISPIVTHSSQDGQDSRTIYPKPSAVNPMEQTVFGYGLDPEDLTQEQRLETLLRECAAGLITQQEFNQRSAGLIK